MQIDQQIQKVMSEYGNTRDISRALKAHGIHPIVFYTQLENNPTLDKQYKDLQRFHADGLIAQCLELSEGEFSNELQVSATRLRTQIRMKIAGYYDRKRFGDKVTHEHEAGPDLIAAISAAKQRVALPASDLQNVIDAEYTTIKPQDATCKTDVKSVSNDAPLDASYIFGD